MTEETTTTAEKPAAKPASKADSSLSKFLDASGYEKSDVDGVNEATNTFVTTNGGKYQLSKKSGTVRTIKGPAYPNEGVTEE